MWISRVNLFVSWTVFLPTFVSLCRALHAESCFTCKAKIFMQVGGESVTNAAAESDHVFMPAFPLYRDLPAFQANSDKTSDGERCSKYHRLHSQLTPGIFTVFCAHGICVGFKFMVNKEGPATAFDLFFSRLIKGEEGSKSIVSCPWRSAIFTHVTRK